MKAARLLSPVIPLQRVRVGSVSYLNAKPLIFGLDDLDSIRLSLDVPSQLLASLRDGRFDVSLLPIIDYQRIDDVRLLTCGGIGCDGPTLTVRIFSRVPVNQIATLACDVHSHSSVALARVILAEQFGIMPEFMDFRHTTRLASAESILLIGDKVVCEEPIGYPHQLDLGAGWKELTGLPFIFAAWVARADAELGDLPDQLNKARKRGMTHLDQIIKTEAIPRGWPAALARQYLTEYLNYEIGPRQIEAIRLFHQLAAKHGMIEHPVRELVF